MKKSSRSRCCLRAASARPDVAALTADTKKPYAVVPRCHAMQEAVAAKGRRGHSGLQGTAPGWSRNSADETGWVDSFASAQ